MYLLFHLGHPDVLPLGDLGVRKGVAVHFGLISGKQALAKGNNKHLPTPDDMLRLTEHWKVRIHYYFDIKSNLFIIINFKIYTM
jgi:DNA-3-methyladenine glycosylase II